MLQLPYHNFKLDSTTFLSAFYTENDGKITREGEWVAGPNDNNDDMRINIAQQWADMVAKREKLIPTIAAKGHRATVNMVKRAGIRPKKDIGKTKEKVHKRVESTCRFCGMNNWTSPAKGKTLSNNG
jgi:hypothetical protein